jgi:RimJ/RimL family protein N-acetyltransferase
MPKLVEYNELFLEKSWEWLNDPEIKVLTMTPDFTKEQQVDFYKSLNGRADYWIKGIEEEAVPIGAMGLKHINETMAEYWGYIGEKKFWGRGIGSFLLEEAIKKAKHLGLRQLYLRVDKNNTRAKQLYIKNGFRFTSPGNIEQYYFDL